MLRSVSADISVRYFGGYPDAERTMLSASPSYLPAEERDYPICAVAFRYRTQRALTHRDVLGTLMSVGVRRDALGDILCGDGISVVFVRAEVASYICEQIDRIGGEGVEVVAHYEGDLPIREEYEAIRDTVASQRLDSVVKALVRCSREQAAEIIRLGAVSVNHLPIESVTKSITDGDIVSVRGYGRFYIDQVGPETKKGRLRLCADKLI